MDKKVLILLWSLVFYTLYMSAQLKKTKMEEVKSDKPLLMIPGPTEFDDDVLAAMGRPTASHVAPGFIEEFGSSIEMVREGFLAKNGQPFIIAGSGSLGWDMIVAGLCEAGENALVVNTGYFSDSFGDW